ncbi:hypothetical protein [Geothrix sp. PMB-07]|uniref:hypothetical protein n=1 Tax=Geothrix sp. PMB-07 TaxID=3068640 RepID=UPI0027407F2F|nr:hypothetical protein [Geothrix sp. PMB-07]WLT30233.1 hypothetical protein Q9293_10935 [Geothrix sp. PMB-07]
MRNWGFWAQDRFHGSPIRRHCQDIETRLRSGQPSTDLLEGILGFAVKHTPFYAPCKGFSSLQDFPVINKNTIKGHYADFKSDAFPGVHLHSMHTSGSTGTPFEVLQDPEKRRRVQAEVIVFGQRAGYELGDRFVYTRVWTDLNRKSWSSALRDNMIPFDISSMEDSRLETLRTLLKKNKNIKSMLGYPSTYGPLAWYLERMGDSPDAFHLETIIAISEKLPTPVRESLRARFGCKVVARYSNQENGILAQQCLDHDEYHLNTASYAFEFLQLDSDLPAMVGEPARMVVTDLFNRAMPMIRYDTGDVVIRQASSTCGWATETLSDIEGRREDFIYDTQDRLLSPSVPGLYFWRFTQLKQIQFIQEGKGQYRIMLNGASEHYRDQEFIDLAKGFLGQDAVVFVTHVDEIPMLASGKFKAIMSRYTPTAEPSTLATSSK